MQALETLCYTTCLSSLSAIFHISSDYMRKGIAPQKDSFGFLDTLNLWMSTYHRS